MEILVTGASGFIGSYITSEMLKRNHTVACIVREHGLQKIQGVELIHADLSDIESLNKVFQKRTDEVVIDSAAKIPLEVHRDEDYFDNILMTRNLLKVLRKTPPRYFLKLSTIDVYRIQNEISESTEVTPENYYSLSKRVSEQLVEIWGKESNVTTCILRLTQIFGIGDRSNKFIPSIIRQIKDQSKITIYGDGSDRRDYLFVEDAARMIADCCEKKVSGIFNLASGKSISLNDVVEIIQEIADKKLDIEYRDRTKPQIDYEFDIKNLVNTLGELKLSNLSDTLRRIYYQEK